MNLRPPSLRPGWPLMRRIKTLAFAAAGLIGIALASLAGPELTASHGVAETAPARGLKPFVPSGLQSPWRLSVNEGDGMPILSKGGKDALTGYIGFWGSNWSWSAFKQTLSVKAPFDYLLSAASDPLHLKMRGNIHRSSTGAMIWDLEFDSFKASEGVIGGGMVFKFDLAAFAAEMGEPRLLPDNRGWSWGREGGSRLVMRFAPDMAKLYFERGNKGELRAFFYSGAIPEGKRTYRITLEHSADIAATPTLGERFGVANMADWPKDILDWNHAPVDLAFLNRDEKPAGKRGFVKARGAGLMFEDGTPARFWGTNLTASALFKTPRDAARQQARRLSALGFNLVRFTHVDSYDPNIYGRGDAPDTLSLDPASLDGLDWWIKCLKDEGIYVWLDLHVRRALKAGDGIYGFDELRKGQDTAQLFGYNYVNPTIAQVMKRTNAALLNHVNPYTGTAYKDEAAIMGLLITNENDLTHHFGNLLLPDKNVPLHNKIYMSEAKAFAKAWRLPEDKTWRAWEPGPSKLFLNDLERRFHADLIDHLRSLGAKSLIATTNAWAVNPLSSLPALTAGDVIDAHSYGGSLELEKDPRIAANMMHWLAAGQVANKPMTVSEWNVERFPVPDRHAIPLYMAGSARLQGWDALMQYAYSQAPMNHAGSPSNWHAYNDPALIATLPAAALLYRQGHVREAATTYVLQPDRQQLFYTGLSPATSAALRTAAEKGKLLIRLPRTEELPWLSSGDVPNGAAVLTDPHRSLLDGAASSVTSDSGELTRDWHKGTYTIDTPLTQAAMGWIGGERIRLADVEIRVSTRNATVAVQSLDGRPVGKSQDLLISLGARAVPESPYRLPFRAEPVEGRLLIRAAEGLKLYRKGPLQSRREVPVAYENGHYILELNKALRTYWLFLKRPDQT